MYVDTLDDEGYTFPLGTLKDAFDPYGHMPCLCEIPLLEMGV